ncbi:type II toxin-antitoxin system PemK/MazF family toxin [Streptomyces broussonetiae]|uniref:Type II toxin-antitoxin system PemK/MazF family toxin n=1 Tax=Streptomyces broussonetiae TaxID=2686304 RepID=A0A6I6N3K1_9ACTN|nr:type II toxin-antitoxin system PemK/MazF family toxin [Streptomyces broussonetiae]QHA04971.1 type II toxin-antitoxin system PemK/MazF family toxin [Streptomyces broussonetiae]
MDTSWWLALAAVVLLALVATLIDGWGRGRRPGGRRLRPPGRAGKRTRAARPVPGDIWWADVPYEDRAESSGAARSASDRAVAADGRSKDRPCLVLAVRGNRATVAKITSKFHDERSGVIPLPPGAVGDARGRPSFLETDELREVPVGDFRRRVGVVDPVLWDQVRHLAG